MAYIIKNIDFIRFLHVRQSWQAWGMVLACSPSGKHGQALIFGAFSPCSPFAESGLESGKHGGLYLARRRGKMNMEKFDKQMVENRQKIERLAEFGFSAAQAIDFLKLMELQEINKKLSGKLYISGDVTTYQA